MENDSKSTYDKKTQYLIPHNFKNNGRIFNIIEKENLIKALICLIPITFIIFYLTPLRIDNKFFFEVILGGPPVIFFGFGIDKQLLDILKFRKNKKVYYAGGGGFSDEDKGNIQYAYENEKKRKF